MSNYIYLRFKLYFRFLSQNINKFPFLRIKLFTNSDLKLKTINDRVKSFYKQFHNRLIDFHIQNLTSPIIPGNPIKCILNTLT